MTKREKVLEGLTTFERRTPGETERGTPPGSDWIGRESITRQDDFLLEA